MNQIPYNPPKVSPTPMMFPPKKPHDSLPITMKSEPRPAANKSIQMQSPQVAAPMERPENPETQRGKNGLTDHWGIHAVRAVHPYLI